MKKTLIVLGLVLTLFSCKDDRPRTQSYVYPPEPTANVVVEPVSNFGDGLDLQALGELVKNSNSAEDIENKLNQPNSINNLDLDQNGEVDYIKVTEYGSGNNRGFSFSVDAPDGSKQDIANVDVNNAGQQVNMNIQGNQQIYGAPVSYQSNFSASDVLLMHYLFTYHRPYYSPYHYGYYPSYYRPYRSVGHSSYRTRTYSTTRTVYKRSNSYNNTRSFSNSKKYSNSLSNTAHKKTSLSNTAYKRSSSLSSPTKSQKSFNVTSRERSRPKTSGFSNSSRKSSGSSYSSGSSRKSSGSFFGSSSRKSSSSSRSSFGSSSRRSSSFGSSSRSSSSRSSSSRSSSSRR